MPDNLRKAPTVASCIAQLIADMETVEPQIIQEIVKNMEIEDNLIPIAGIKKYLTEHSNKIPHFAALVIRDMPFYKVIEALEVVDGVEFFKNYADDLIKCLGPIRAYYIFSGLEYLRGGEKLAKETFHPNNGDVGPLDSMPKVDDINSLSDRLKSALVPVKSLLLRDEVKSTNDAQARAVKAEHILDSERAKWAKTQERIIKEAKRGKQNSVNKAVDDISNELKLNIRTLEEKLEAELQAKNEAVANLKKAEKRLQEIEDSGGATPERVKEIRAEIQKEAEMRLADELSDKTRPWITIIKNATEAYAAYDEATKLSREALEQAKKEAIEKDPILKWTTHSAQAIAALQAQLSQIDALINVTVEPSAALKSMRAKLLELLTICRERANPAEPTGEVMKALHVGIKNVPADNINEVIDAFLLLSTFDVLAHEEGQNLKRALESRKRLLIESGKIKSTTRTKLKAAIHKKEKVVLAVDVLNFMRRNENEFSKFKKGKDSRGATLYKSEAFDHLVKMVTPLRNINPKIEIHLFMDGNIIKNTQPREGITFHNPTIQTTGEGQADAEIINFLAHGCPKDALVVTVTSDKVIQQTSDKHLDTTNFYSLLEDFKE